jgi:uncharacterized membrane protein YfhO
MTITLDPSPPDSSYVVVAENWYHDWRAVVDGAPAKVYRGNWTLITVAVPAGAKRVELAFVSSAYNRGKLLTLLSLLIAVSLVVAPPITRRWRDRRAAPGSGHA